MDELFRKQRKLHELAMVHVEACVDAARKRHGEVYAEATTPAATGLASMSAMMMCCAWSLGCSVASNNLPKEQQERVLAQLLDDVAQQFRDGMTKPGEGRMF